MPVSVVKFTRDRLHEQPDKWGVENSLLGRSRQELAVRVYSAEATVSFLVTSHSWYLLNEKSLPCINEVLGQDLDRCSLYNEQKLHDYLRTLDYMVVGQGSIMDKEFVRRELDPKYARKEWLDGRVKSVEALRRLCYRPTVNVQGNQVAITYNRITYGGSVLRRTVHARLGKWLEITGLEELEILPTDTFSYAYLGGGG